MASFPGYTIVSSNTCQIHYDITITLDTSGSKWTGSIVIYEVMHGPRIDFTLTLTPKNPFPKYSVHA